MEKIGAKMDESILTSIKKLLGLTEDYTAFDQQITMHINAVILVLKQIDNYHMKYKYLPIFQHELV